ncbi:MAG: DivIVA domain-containing protein, partial [Bacteroidota bacterium]
MITPIEIRQQSFKRALRGYDKDEVDAFLLALSQEWEHQLEAYRSLKEELEKTQSKYNTLKEVEDILHKTLMQAEQSSRDALE